MPDTVISSGRPEVAAIFPALHIRPPRGWINDPNGVCRIDGRYHVFFQFNPDAPVHTNVHWGHVSSTDLLRWQEHPVALAPRSGGVDAGGCWSGCIVDDGGTPTAVYSAVPTDARSASVVLARSDRTLQHWTADESPVAGPPAAAGMEARDPFVFSFDGRRYAVQGAGGPGVEPQILLYSCDDLTEWTELPPLLTYDNQLAAEIAPADVWECPNLALIDGRWVLLISALHLPAGSFVLDSVRYLVGDLTRTEAGGLRFTPASGGRLDDGPAFYAPQLATVDNRVLLWGWSWELGRSAEQKAAAGWAGVLTFPRELGVRGGELISRPAAELADLRCELLDLSEPIAAPAFEIVADGPVTLSLMDAGGATTVSRADGTPDDPVRILVDGSIVETFAAGRSRTTRAYPSASTHWSVAGEATVGYRLALTG